MDLKRLENMRYSMVLMALLSFQSLFSQTNSYSVTLTPFSSLTNDEFSPIFYNGGIVFCSNLKNNSLITYQKEHKNLFNMFFVSKKDSVKWGSAKILAKELTTNYNRGPATFNEKGNIIYYCRNNDVKVLIKDISDTTNNLGLYSAEFINGQWTNIKPFAYNNPQFSFVTPALTSDGERLYFATNMPGGYGGFDLYYCDWTESGWSKPINLGPTINTPKNESFPFACKSGKLFFSSDGHAGYGGKDLYYSQEIEGKWINPIHLDAEINSAEDDFGLVTDASFENGYFSSNRRKTDDIYYFLANPVQFSQCDSMLKNNYCFLFYDEYQNDNDSIPVIYEWDFGNGIKKTGLKVKHCFPGPGKYEVKLNIIDSLRRDSIRGTTSYVFELKDNNQVFINSPDAGIVGNNISFDGLKTNLPNFKISDYLWNFGEGFNIRGPATSKIFNKKGQYTIELGLLGEKDSLGNNSKTCVFKKIKIFEDYQEWAMHDAKEVSEHDGFYTIENDKKPVTKLRESSSLRKDSSKVKDSNSLMVKIYLLNNLSELQKDSIFKNLYETRNFKIEITDSEIDTSSYLNLFKFVKVLKENPDLKLEIAVHTDDKGFSGHNLEISEKWARKIYTYFLENGITPESIHCKGYGESRPMPNNGKNKIDNQNKRVEFIFLNNPN